jgi:hypothetical protein
MKTRLGIFRIVGVIAFTSVLALAQDSAPTTRGGRVAWGRLRTPSPSWDVHSPNDSLLAAFIHKQTSLNIDPTCYPADPAQLDQLCRYPFIFTNNLMNVSDAKQLANLREYLHRGGFLYIDRCVNLAMSIPQEPFYSGHLALFAQLLPEAKIRELPETHEIYNSYFSLDVAERAELLSHRQGQHQGIYGVYVDGRMVALISLAHFQCGWPQSRPKEAASMKMIANIYVYAMTHPAEPVAKTP